MKLSLYWIFAFGVLLASVIAEDVEEVRVDEDAESRSGITQDKVQPRVHPHLFHHHHGLHHHHALHGHHAHLHHAHHLHAFAHHHPILTKKLLLLKFKKVLPHLAHHHHHLAHAHHHHGHHHHHLLHHALLHHHLFRAAPSAGSDSVLELIPISDPTGTLAEANVDEPQTNFQYVGDNQGVQAYAIPADYLQGQLQDEPELDNYEEVSLDDVPESVPINKHLVAPEEGIDQAPVYLYAVPQQVELGRSANRINKNRRKFKN